MEPIYQELPFPDGSFVDFYKEELPHFVVPWHNHQKIEIMQNLGNPAGAFWFYGVIAILALIWGYFYMPETKGVSLENIESFWRKGGTPRELK